MGTTESTLDKPSAAFWDLPLELGGTIPSDRSGFLRLHAIPEHFAGRALHGTAVIIHGGYWQNQFGLDDDYGNAGVISLAPFFLARGFGAVELEYRRRDHEGGGWPGTNEDILAGLEAIAGLRHWAEEGGALAAEGRKLEAMSSLRPERLILIGHSAGGCLALWAAHQQLTAPAEVALAMAMSPVGDLVQGYARQISEAGTAVEKYMKCKPDSEEARAEYAKASPQALLPVTFPTLIAYGDKDTDVPVDFMEQYAEAARTGSPELVRVVRVPDVGHFEVVNAAHPAWLDHVVPVAAAMLERDVSADAAAALLQR